MTAKIDRTSFYANFPASKLFGRKLTATRQVGFDALFDVWDAAPHYDFIEWLAYALATAWHETQATMHPVREGLAKSDPEAVAIVTEYCRNKGITNYAARHANGQSYYGRGYVQLTFADNYIKMGQELGLGKQLYDTPDKVLDPAIGAQILLTGLVKGKFRPKFGTLFDYFNAHEQLWFAARDLVNGDKNDAPKWADGKTIGELVAGYARAFRSVIKTV